MATCCQRTSYSFDEWQSHVKSPYNLPLNYKGYVFWPNASPLKPSNSFGIDSEQPIFGGVAPSLEMYQSWGGQGAFPWKTRPLAMKRASWTHKKTWALLARPGQGRFALTPKVRLFGLRSKFRLTWHKSLEAHTADMQLLHFDSDATIDWHNRDAMKIEQVRQLQVTANLAVDQLQSQMVTAGRLPPLRHPRKVRIPWGSHPF